MLSIGDRVVIEERHGVAQTRVSYAGTVTEVRGMTVFVNVDLDDPATMPIVEEMAELYGHPLANFPARKDWIVSDG